MSEEAALLTLPKDNFISDYDIAYQIVTSAHDSHAGLWQLIKDCQSHISGKKPTPPKELEKRGMSWASNFNFGKARAKIEKGVAESTSKISSALALGYATFRAIKKEERTDEIMSFLMDDNKRGIVASAIGYALASTLSKETRLSGWLNEIEYPSFAFGYCALLFNKFDWMPEPVHPLNISFKPNTKPEKIEQFIVYDIIDAEDLYKRWVTARNEKSKADNEGSEPKQIASSGWNLTGLEAILYNAFKGKIGDNKTAETWEQVIPTFQENASYVISNTQSVSIAKIFHRELDGTLSEVYIPWDNPWQVTKNRSEEVNTSTVNNVGHILFKKNHGKYNQSKVITLIRDSGFTSDAGCIQDLRGIAKFSVEDSIRYNRLRNGILNKMQFIGTPMFEQPTSQSGEKFKITVSQGFVLLPSSHNLIERQPNFDVSSHINVLRFEEGEFNRDTQQYDATIQGRLTSRPNKGEVQRVTEEVEFTDSAKNNIKLRDYASVFKAVLSRIPEVNCQENDPGYEGKERFYSTLKKNLAWLAVETDEQVDKILDAVDSFVMEPIISNIETITIAIQMAETPFARNRLKRMLLIAKGFPIEEVNLAVPLITDKFANLNDDRVAAFENDMFFTTNEVIISGTDDHIVHLDSHMAKAGRVVQGAQQRQLSPVDAFKYLENILIHIIQHAEMLGQDPLLSKKAEEYMVGIDMLTKSKNQIKGVAEQMMQEEQAKAQQMQLDPKTQAEIARDNVKAQSDTQRKDWLAQQRTGQRDKQIDQSHEQRMREIELKAQDEQLNQ